MWHSCGWHPEKGTVTRKKAHLTRKKAQLAMVVLVRITLEKQRFTYNARALLQTLKTSIKNGWWANRNKLALWTTINRPPEGAKPEPPRRHFVSVRASPGPQGASQHPVYQKEGRAAVGSLPPYPKLLGVYGPKTEQGMESIGLPRKTAQRPVLGCLRASFSHLCKIRILDR